MGEMVRLDLRNDEDSASGVSLLHDVGPNNAGGSTTGDRAWRLNFDDYQVSPHHTEKPPRKLHDCLGVSDCSVLASTAGWGKRVVKLGEVESYGFKRIFFPFEDY